MSSSVLTQRITFVVSWMSNTAYRVCKDLNFASVVALFLYMFNTIAW